jgi:hypothetical protein
MSVTVTFEGESHADILSQVKEWLATVEPEGRLTYTEAVEQGAELTKDALRVIAASAPAPVADNDLVKALTDMGYKATDATSSAIVDGINRVEELSGDTIVTARERGRSAVYEMNASIAKQILRVLRPR